MGPVFLFLIFWYHALKTREKVHEQMTTAFSSMDSLRHLLSQKQEEDEFDLEDEDTMFHFQQSIDYIDRLFLQNVSFAFVLVPVWTLLTSFTLMVILLFIARGLDLFADVRKHSHGKLKFDNSSRSRSVDMLRFFELTKSFSENEIYYHVNYLFYHPEIATFLAILPVLITIIYVIFILSPLDKIDARLVHVHIDIIFACIMIASMCLMFVPLMVGLDKQK